MNSPLRLKALRFIFLLIGTVCAGYIFMLGFFVWGYAQAAFILVAQCIFLFLVSGLSLSGIFASTFFPESLRRLRVLRVTFIAPAILFPLNDLFPVLAGDEWGRWLLASLVFSAVFSFIIVLAIASAWLPVFSKGTTSAHG